MISFAESGLTLPQYEAIRDGLYTSTHLRVSKKVRTQVNYTRSNSVNSTTIWTNFFNLGMRKVYKKGDYFWGLSQTNNYLWLSRGLSSSPTSVGTNFLDIINDGTDMYLFRGGTGGFARSFVAHTAVPGADPSTVVTATDVISATSPHKDTCYYFKSGGVNNWRLCRAVWNGAVWTETASDLYFNDHNANNMLKFPMQSLRMDDGRDLIVFSVVLADEYIQRAVGATATTYTSATRQYLSLIWGDEKPNLVWETKSPTMTNFTYMKTFVRRGDEFVLMLVNSRYSKIQGTIASDVPVLEITTKNGTTWSHPKFTKFYKNREWNLPVEIGTISGLKYYATGSTPVGTDLDTGDIFWGPDTNVSAGQIFSSHYEYTWEEITDIITDWEFQNDGTLIVNFNSPEKIVTEAIKSEIGYMVDGVICWLPFGITYLDNVSGSKTASDSGYDIEYRYSTSDATRFLVSEVQSYDAVEFLGQNPIIEEFSAQGSKLALQEGAIAYGSDGDGAYLEFSPSITTTFGRADITGIADKRNHIGQFWFNNAGGGSARVMPINRYSNTLANEIFLSVGSAGIEYRARINGVDKDTQSIVVASVRHIRYRMFYGLVEFWYSTAGTTWTKVSRPIPYTGLTISEFADNVTTTTPWGLYTPAIGVAGATVALKTKFHKATVTNLHDALLFDDIKQIASSFIGLHDTFPAVQSDLTEGYLIPNCCFSAMTPASGNCYSMKGYGINNYTNSADYLRTSVYFEGTVGSKWTLKKDVFNSLTLATTTTTLETSSGNLLASTPIKVNVLVLPKSTTNAILYILVSHNGEKVFAHVPVSLENADGNNLTNQASSFFGFTDIVLNADQRARRVLTFDPGESPSQGLDRVADGWAYNQFWINSQGQMRLSNNTDSSAMLNNVTSDPVDTVDFALILAITSTSKDMPVKNISYLRLIKTYEEVEGYAEYLEGAGSNAGYHGEESGFRILQNTLLDHPFETGEIKSEGVMPLSHTCEIHPLLEFRDFVVPIGIPLYVNGISGRYELGSLNGSVQIYYPVDAGSVDGDL